MKIALISDIHGNAIALDTVLAAGKRDRPDRMICLGDVAGMGPQPREVIDRLRTLDIPVVNGNVDDMILTPPTRDEMPPDRQPVADILQWGATQLSSADREYLRTFRPTVEVELGPDATLLCFHGSPASNWDIILATTPDDELDRLLAGRSASVMTGGHTHVQMIRRHRAATIVNPGSVGLPAETSDAGVRHPPWAEYGMVTWEGGELGIELRRVPIDVPAIVEAAHRSGMPNSEWWTAAWEK